MHEPVWWRFRGPAGGGDFWSQGVGSGSGQKRATALAGGGKSCRAFELLRLRGAAVSTREARARGKRFGLVHWCTMLFA